MADRLRTAPLDWNDIRFFAALARHGSLSATARALRVNHATVSRRLAGLESALGQVLFDRRPEGFVPTASGEALLAKAWAMEAAAHDLQQAAAGTGASTGPVRVTTPRTLAAGFLATRLAALHRRQPRLDLILLTDARNLSLARREADIAIRLGRPEQAELLARRLGDLPYRFYGTPDCRQRLDQGAEPLLIGYAEDDDGAEAAWLARHFPAHRVAFRSNSQQAQAAAAAAGCAIALLPCYLAPPGCGLVQIDLGARPPDRAVWLLMRRDAAGQSHVRAVADHVIEIFRREWPILAAPDPGDPGARGR